MSLFMKKVGVHHKYSVIETHLGEAATVVNLISKDKERFLFVIHSPLICDIGLLKSAATITMFA